MRQNCGEYAVAENWQNYETRVTGLHHRLGKESGAVASSAMEKLRGRVAQFLKRK